MRLCCLERVCGVTLTLLFVLDGRSAGAQAAAPSLEGVAALPKVAVLGVRGDGVEESTRAGVTDILAVELSRTERFRVITPQDINALVDLSTMRDVMGCDTGDCLQTLSELGGALDVGRLLSGHITEVEGAQVLNVVLLDTKNTTVVGRGSAKLDHDLESTIQATRQALLESLGYSGRIVLWNQPEGADIYLDGRHMGTAPVPALDVEKPGTYQLQVFHDNHTPWEANVDVAQGAVRRMKVDSLPLVALEEEADSRDRWAWGFVASGGVVMALSGAVWGLTFLAQSEYEQADFRGQDLSTQKAYTDTILTRTVAAGSLSAVGTAALGVGLYLLFTNHYRDRLEAATRGASMAGISLVPTQSGAIAGLSARF